MRYGVSCKLMLIVYIIELFSVWCWLIGFYGFPLIYRRVSQWNVTPSLPSKTTKGLLFVYIFAFMLIIIVSLGSGLESYGRMDSYDAYSFRGEIHLPIIGLSIPKTIWVIIKALFYLPGMLAGGVLATRPRPAKSIGKLIGWALMIFLVIYG